jgi:hypothetical protein
MTPFIDRGEAIHDPGKFTMSILGDLGWVNTRVIHQPPTDTEENITSVNLNVRIESDTAYYFDRVGIAWSFNGFAGSDTLFMSPVAAGDTYSASIPVPSYNSRLDYYLFAEDRFARVFRSPSYIEKTKYSFYIGADTVRPVITHTPASYYLEKVDSIRFDASVSDNIGIDTVYVEYRVNNGASFFAGIGNEGNSIFTRMVRASSLDADGGDSLFYRFIAIDSSSGSNIGISPDTGYFPVRFEPLNPVADSYTTDFSDASGDFLNEGFSIEKPAGFSNHGLHTPHPYESPEEKGDSIGYCSILRTPLIYDADGMIISFMELVLVEPGETGSLFGSPDFFDYVIVEGSRNFGRSWFRLADGYDSRLRSSWLDAYNSSVDDINSTCVGEESLLLNHTIFPKEVKGISAGDTMVIRFRLFSDPYAHGWGWVIENFHASALVNSVAEARHQPFTLYPNPGNGVMQVLNSGIAGDKPRRYSVYNSTGQMVKSAIVNLNAGEIIDISGLTPGLYLVVFSNGKQTWPVRYILER